MTTTVWYNVYFPAPIETEIGPSRSLIDRLSPPATEWAGRASVMISLCPAITATQAGPSSAEPPPLAWLRNSPMTRPSRVSLAA